MSKVEKIVWDAIEPVVNNEGCTVYDVEFAKEGPDYFLRVFIDKEGGVSTDDCEKVSRSIEPLLDELDPIEPSYYLEVSSPGLDRKLSRDEHFVAAMGKLIDIKLFAPLNGKKDITALLEGFDGNVISVKLDDGTVVDIEKQKASSVRLAVVF